MMSIPSIRQLFVIIGMLLIWGTNSLPSFSQSSIPGVSMFDSTGYVEYIPGNLPIILSAPHGGYLEPASIPDRNCPNCVYVRDSYTQELTRSMNAAFFEETGCFPYVVINLLHRKKFDANRNIGDAADGNPIVEQAWDHYHAFLDSAKAKIVRDYGRGLFIDMHGHGHTIQRLELGYLLSRSELQLSDTDLNSQFYIDQSSIRTLVGDNLQGFTHAELLRASFSLGTMLENQGIPSIPSAPDPFPLNGEAYFSGGYNTARHGSVNGGKIDGIQIECHQDIRFDASKRENFADSLVKTINAFIDLHYDDAYIDQYCNIGTNVDAEILEKKIDVFPNPSKGFLHIHTEWQELDVSIFNQHGQKVCTHAWKGTPLDIRFLKPGCYFLAFNKEGFRLGSKVLIKQ